VEIIKPLSDLTTPELVEFLERTNKAYRAGTPIIDDLIYDQYFSGLIERDPNHPFLNQVEPEGDFGTGKVRHVRPMLSTEKAYASGEIAAWLKRIDTAAKELGIETSSLLYRITPKLDGMAGKYSVGKLVTRGNGEVGNDVTYVFDRGVKAIGGQNTGLGEIVLQSEAWQGELSEKFSHPRSVVVGIVSSDEINPDCAQVLESGHVHFAPYSTLKHYDATADELMSSLNAICDELENGCGYPTDGSVIEVTDERLREHMGATSHHYRWQIAWKRVGETAISVVTGINWQTGRTGRVTPIIKIEKTWLSGAGIENVTGHHAGNIRNLDIGTGCEIKIVRSGEIIPKLLGITKHGSKAVLPTCCPSCNFELSWEGDFLNCDNPLCSAKIANRLIHFFNTIGNIDLFGEKTIAVLLNHGVDELPDIYKLTEKNFLNFGFGPKQSQNLVRELKRSLKDPIENWRFLASFGIRHLGRGDSRRLLNHFQLADLQYITPEQIQALDSFGPLKAPRISKELRAMWPLIETMINLGFNLTGGTQPTAPKDSPIAGLNIVFTGTMQTPRSALQEQAIQLGANAQSAVSSTTNILVVGENVGAKKIEAARKHNTRILDEQAYLELISAPSLPNEPEQVPVETILPTKASGDDQLSLFA